MQVNTRDAASGVIFMAVGGLSSSAPSGSRSAPRSAWGPDTFRWSSRRVLIASGWAPRRLLRRGLSSDRERAWRGLILILSAPIIFGLTVRELGLLPGIALVVLISSFASRRVSVRLALALTVGLTAFCVLVFGVGLRLPIPLLGPWLVD